jgi:hypothetical protein
VGFGLVPIPLHFQSDTGSSGGIHAITELGSCAVEFELFSQYILYEQHPRTL